MSSNHSTASLSSRKPLCFAHNHLSFAEYGLYSHLREVSSKSKPQFVYQFDDRTIAERFAPERGCSKDTVNRLRRSLAKKGFIVWLEPQKKNAGKFVPRRGRILSHREWAEQHPGGCSDCVISPVSNSDLYQSQVAEHQSHSEGHQSQVEASPVSNKPLHQSQQRDIKGITTNGISKRKYPLPGIFKSPSFFWGGQ